LAWIQTRTRSCDSVHMHEKLVRPVMLSVVQAQQRRTAPAIHRLPRAVSPEPASYEGCWPNIITWGNRFTSAYKCLKKSLFGTATAVLLQCLKRQSLLPTLETTNSSSAAPTATSPGFQTSLSSTPPQYFTKLHV